MPEAPKKSLHKISPDFSVSEKNKKALHFIEDVTSKPDEIQKLVLSEILSRNAHVEYLQRHGLAGQTDRDTFKKIIPVIKYEDIQLDINRIANGDKSPILCSHPISEFLTRYSFTMYVNTCTESCSSPLHHFIIQIICRSITN